METSYLERRPAGADLLHGPLALVDAAVRVIAVVTPGAGGRAVLPALKALRARHADRCSSPRGTRRLVMEIWRPVFRCTLKM